MKAFIPYPKEAVHLRLLLRKLQDHGTINCDFETFTKLYEKWHLKTFPGCPINTQSAIFREDWFYDFLNFLISSDI